MGLGIYIKGEIKKSVFSFVKKPVNSTTIKNYFEANSSGIFKDVLGFSENENVLRVTLHPCEEDVQFEFRTDGSIICSAKTNSVGPGYHAYLVESIEKLGKQTGIEWAWDLEEGEDYYTDETGYYQHQKFDLLQLEMLKWLKGMSGLVVEKDMTQLMICFPVNYPRITRDYDVISALGAWDRSWFERVFSAEVDHLQDKGKEFFIWWNKELDALFYKNTGIALLNLECPWHYCINDEERKLYSTINNCFEKARQLDSSIELPEEDWRAVKQFMNDEEDIAIPETAYGYRKHLMTFDLSSGWMIDLPGNWYNTTQDTSDVFWDGIKTVRITIYTNNDGEEEDAKTFFKDSENSGAEVIYPKDSLNGKSVLYYYIDKEENDEYWILQGIKIVKNKLLLSTICFPSSDDKEWAIETWNSIKNPAD